MKKKYNRDENAKDAKLVDSHGMLNCIDYLFSKLKEI